MLRAGVLQASSEGYGMTTYAWPGGVGANRLEMTGATQQACLPLGLQPGGSAGGRRRRRLLGRVAVDPGGRCRVSPGPRSRPSRRLRGSQNFLSLYLPPGSARCRARTMRGGTTATMDDHGAVDRDVDDHRAVDGPCGRPARRRLRYAVAQFDTSCTLSMLPGYRLRPVTCSACPTGRPSCTSQRLAWWQMAAAITGRRRVAPSARSAMAAWGAITWGPPDHQLPAFATARRRLTWK